MRLTLTANVLNSTSERIPVYCIVQRRKGILAKRRDRLYTSGLSKTGLVLAAIGAHRKAELAFSARIHAELDDHPVVEGCLSLTLLGSRHSDPASWPDSIRAEGHAMKLNLRDSQQNGV